MKKLQLFTERDLLTHLKAGDERALRQIFDQYWDKLLAYALNRLKNEQEAQEIVQDLFIKLWTIRENLNIQISLGAYLSRAITNRVYDRLDKLYRASRKNDAYINYAIEPLSAAADTMLFEKELQQEIEKAINILPEKCRIVFTKSRFEGFSNAEIAKQLSLSRRTVEKHISNALKIIRQNLSASTLLLLTLETTGALANMKHFIK